MQTLKKHRRWETPKIKHTMQRCTHLPEVYKVGHDPLKPTSPLRASQGDYRDVHDRSGGTITVRGRESGWEDGRSRWRTVMPQLFCAQRLCIPHVILSYTILPAGTTGKGVNTYGFPVVHVWWFGLCNVDGEKGIPKGVKWVFPKLFALTVD